MTASLGDRDGLQARGRPGQLTTFLELSADSLFLVGAGVGDGSRAAVLALGSGPAQVQLIPQDLAAALRLHEATALLVARLTPARLVEVPR